MEFSGKLTEDDLNDIARLLRPRLYWLRVLLENWHGTALIAAIVWATILALSGQAKPNWWAMGLTWFTIVAIFIWAAYTVRRGRAQELAQLNATLPERLSLTREGVTWNRPDGAKALLRWSQVKGWRERPRVVAIDEFIGTPAVILSVAHLSETERQHLRDFLRSQIPPATPRWIEAFARRSRSALPEASRLTDRCSRRAARAVQADSRQS